MFSKIQNISYDGFTVWKLIDICLFLLSTQKSYENAQYFDNRLLREGDCGASNKKQSLPFIHFLFNPNQKSSRRTTSIAVHFGRISWWMNVKSTAIAADYCGQLLPKWNKCSAMSTKIHHRWSTEIYAALPRWTALINVESTFVVRDIRREQRRSLHTLVEYLGGST